MRNTTRLGFILLLIAFTVISITSYLFIHPYFKKTTFMIIELLFVGLSFPIIGYLENSTKKLFYIYICILGYAIGLLSYAGYWIFFDLGFEGFLNEIGKSGHIVFTGIFLYSIFSFCFLILPLSVLCSKKLVKFNFRGKSSASN